MPVMTRQVGPCFAAEVDGLDLTRPLSAGRRRGDPRRHGPVRGARLPRPAARRRAAARLHPQPGRDRARHRHEPAGARRVPPADDLRRRVEPRQEPPGLRARRPPAALRHRQPALALRQLVQGGPGEVLAAARAQRPVEGRQHRVRRHARGLRRPRRRDEGRDRGPGLRALADLLAPAARLHRLHRRGARALQAGAPAPGAHASRRPGASRSTSPRTRAASSAGRCRRRAPSCAT